MPPAKLPHDVSPFLQRVRSFLLGREHTSYLRFPERIAARTQPPPSLPGGCNDKLANNYYFTRDGRRLVQPDETVLVNSATKKIAEGKSVGAKSESSELTVTGALRIPGQPYQPVLRKHL
ncbi:hypothetical protein Anas_11008 [Armadillidium nasatum]|uniref:NADH dehydrogenase [ubiquinone] 1 alpha subcomplex subunit 7 n=1 Tax=Armadillidium nasatum TaxID=96803 RepID=A0A5N5SXN0_9CRUS|nr:hypothetical protein Anas_11008 [Armadillidium nasatum]